MSKGPGFRNEPDHELRVTPCKKHVRIYMEDRLIGDSYDALILKETGQDPVLYIPINDLKNINITPSYKQTYCPFKGRARHYHVIYNNTFIRDALWTYEKPYDWVAEIKDHVAFYPGKIDEIKITTQ
jgi:uncharacterized protein (DUF427 family)